MPLLNFQSRFVAPIRAGIKAHTIRAERVHPVKDGDKLYLYCGLRHPGAYRILPEPVTCTKVETILIEAEACCKSHFSIVVDGYILAVDECETLARADGFENFAEMMKFWDGRLPFVGQIIHWQPLESA